ncbi:cytochrome P450 [Actinoplanes tereljensis]|uniref:Cytochrome P450 n=1 Tax=Paractinoplanes tereljensis TaxID=571912 RepID=A0A919NX31_9ACTN|nr:cytochrome P450 [Actinoplanes tereljensis]GIF25484.1 cytochrome P450 [Actinoplanes tereljensis]
MEYPFTQPSALEPPAEWARLRDECPVSRVRMASGDETVLLTRYEDVRTLLADPRFTHNLSRPDAARIADSESGGVFNEASLVTDMTSGEGHLRWRRMMSRSFTAKRVNALRPRIEEIAHELISAVQPPVDLVSALGFPLPVFVICELLGVPADHRDRFAHWSDAMLNLTKFKQDELDTAAREFHEFMAAHVLAKRDNPGDDLLSELATIVDAQDGRLTEVELIITAQGLLVAGHETTANMIGKMVAMLLADRSRWEALLADRGLIPSAVEEALRFDANPNIGIPRYVSEQYEVAGETLPAGTTVITNLASANRDGCVFADADEMVLDRRPNPHIAFGAGPHSCLGQALARVELQTVLGVLLDRLPGLRLDVEPAALRRREGLVVGGIEEVPVRW